MNQQEQKQHILNRDFDALFIGQGWDDAPPSQPLLLHLRNDKIFTIDVKFQKRGFVVCFCQDEEIFSLSNADRKKLLYRLGKMYYEHLLITHSDKKQQWMVSIRPQDRPMQLAIVEWQSERDPKELLEKLAGLIFPLAEEEKLTITDVVQRVRFAFATNMEKVTKKFYRHFQQKLGEFDSFIDGIEDLVSKKQYAALMLNRLMFIYFIQKKHFLNNDLDYLQNRLRQTQTQYGTDQFHHKFYRQFLRRLFHEGLDTPASKRSKEINDLLGQVPYLNGGLFDEHLLEIDNDNIKISDAAFKTLFDFFDTYQWRLDTRSNTSGRDINPDVLGYIFEKYINERAQMGAYYTQEDITGYIAKNTILPFLLQRTQIHCKNAFEDDGGIWKLLQNNPDHYIYDALKHGGDRQDEDIPKEIHAGIATDVPDLLKRRQQWNTSASPEFALPTETWREVIARRQRHIELKEKIAAGEIRHSDDLITHNLDIVRFVSDAIREYEGTDFIAALFKTIAGIRHSWVIGTNERTKRGISILDPACGSGAFLFAALNILAPLYEDCVDRMREFVKNDDDRIKASGGRKKHDFFRRVLAEINQHPNERYWIYKTIILENLYGVDIMPEAAEIAKLRLFLKLAAEATYNPNKVNLGLEPLPDIDYNIRTGNALVGFANMRQLEDTAASQKFDLSGGSLARVRGLASNVQQANDRFRQAQDQDDNSYIKAKQDLAEELATLNKELNQYLAIDYGGDKNYPAWEKSYKPFHWLAEFYGIVENNGGFDVVIGNPPYVKYSETKKEYIVINYATKTSNNLYAMFIERIGKFVKNHIGMIVQLPLICTDGMKPAQNILRYFSSWFLSFDDRPGKLFNDIENIRACVFITSQKNKTQTLSTLYSTHYKRWHTHIRHTIFQNINFINHQGIKHDGAIPKIGNSTCKSIYQKIIQSSGQLKQNYVEYNSAIAKIDSNNTSQLAITTDKRGASRGNLCYFHNAPRYWIRATDFIPYFWNEQDGEKQSVQVKNLLFPDKKIAVIASAIINSSLFYWWFIMVSDCRHLIKRDIDTFPIDLKKIATVDYPTLSQINKELMKNYRFHATRKETTYKTTGKVIYDEFHPTYAKPIIDKIDCILAKHYHFTDEELDYIINYDIKYRMGSNNNE